LVLNFIGFGWLYSLIRFFYLFVVE